MQARDLMTRDHLWSVHQDSSCLEVAQVMSDQNIGAVPVLDDKNALQGIVTDRDVCCRLVGRGRSADTPVREIMSTHVHTVAPDAELGRIESVMRRHKVRRLPVADERNRLCGFIAMADLARHVASPDEEQELAHTLETICLP